jgi:hypothetical protein
MKHLDYFIGKYCSIFTKPYNRDLYRENPKNPGVVFQYFVGEITEADEDGVTIKRIMKGLKTFVPMGCIVAIAEEEKLDPNNPEDARAIKGIMDAKERLKTSPPPQVPTGGTFGKTLDPIALQKLAQDVKSKFGHSK